MSSKKFKIFFIILIVIAFFFLNKFAKTKIENAFYIATSPLREIFQQGGRFFQETISPFFEIKNLKIQNQLLFSRNLKLLQKINQLKRLEEENQALKKILNLPADKKFEFLLAKMIAEETDRDFILIDRGEDSGVQKNMVIITEEGVLVGKVKEVFPDFSKVKLITARDFVFEILINQDLALAKGKGNLKLSFQLLPKENQLKKGDLVQTTAFGGTFPEGLLVGEVSKIEKSDLEPYRQGEISPFFTHSQLKFLFLIKNFTPLK